MITKYITVLEAEEKHILTDGEHYCTSVMLRFDETPNKWSEITEDQYKEILQNKNIDKK